MVEYKAKKRTCNPSAKKRFRCAVEALWTKLSRVTCKNVSLNPLMIYLYHLC